jgi:peptide/nickel transport system ATP-binding protein
MNSELKPILEARDLTKHFYTGNALSRRVVKAVQEASFKLYPGHVTALVGESGSGKSTIIRMLARLYEPTSGQILFKGRDITLERSRQAVLRYRSQVQMIFQDPFSSLNPVHNITYHLRRPLVIHGKVKHRRDTQEIVHALLRRVALTPVEEFAAKYPHQLSGGQRQRVAIARALAVEPEVMLADEPVSMLDVSIRLGVLNLMAQLRDEQNIAFLYVTHDIASARYFADQTLVMYAGHIVEGAASEDLIREPQHPYTQMLLASVPDPARGLRTQEVEIRGEIPDLTKLGAGCPFAPRCSHVMDRCNEAMPPRTALASDRWVRCYLYEGGAVGASASASQPTVGGSQ